MSVHFFTQDDLDHYRLEDPLAALLGDERARGFTTERWLAESEAKRMIAWHVYGPLLSAPRQRIIDIGGGFSSLSFLLAERHDYLVCDLCAHDPRPTDIPTYAGDWWDLMLDDFDLIVSVDLFPNVDQRLAAFIGRKSGPKRLALTTYRDRWYRVLREGGEEILTVQAWDWDQTARVIGCAPDVQPPDESLFPNGRQVCLLA